MARGSILGLFMLCVTLGGASVDITLLAQAAVTPDVRAIPKVVMSTFETKFRSAEIRKWTREKENGVVLYDIEFTQGARKMEVDIRADGSIENWEKQIAADALPAPVKQTVEREYPKSTIVEAMEVTAVKSGKEALEGYEVVLRTAGNKQIEKTIAPDGKVLE